jgi:short-subunit dehydrogenase
MDFLNRTAVITGASKGLGREIALRLSKKKANVILIARNEKLLQQLQKEIETLTGRTPMIIPCDVSHEQEVQEMAGIIQGSYQQVDVLINNAGIGIHKRVEHLGNEEMRKQFEVNVFGPFYCIKAFLPLLQKSKLRYILNIGSLTGTVPYADNSIYAATKRAFAGFTEGVRLELKRKNIDVGILLPGLMNTTFQSDRETQLPSFMVLDPKIIAKIVERMIIKRKKCMYAYRWVLLPMKMRQILS